MRHTIRTLLAPLALVATLAVSGCAFTGIGCESEIAFFVSDAVPCLLFLGDCCPTKDDDDFALCGSLDEAFLFPCGEGAHDEGCFCFEADSNTTEVRQSTVFATYGTPPFTYDVLLPFTGMTSAHHLSFDVIVDNLQTFSGAVTYSAGFGFNGFTALGAPGTEIGSYGGDFSADGVADITLPVRAAGFDTAFVDINLDGQATVVDPTIQHLANVPSPGAHTFNLTLPAGGDMAPNLARAFRAFRAHVFLAAGIFDNPPNPGSYSVAGTFTSVDPDTGGAGNGTGQSPMTVNVPPSAISIDPSPLELLDHFLCYKTKASKGNVCGATAAANAGGLCASDAECGGVAGSCGKNKLPKGVQRALADRFSVFAARTADVTKPARLCTPADKNGEGRNDTVTHLRAYAVKDAKGTPKRVASSALRIVNQLGTIAVQVKAPDSLLEPAAKALGTPAPALGAHTVDRYQCYKAKTLTKRCAGNPARTCKTNAACGVEGPCLGKFPKGVQVTVADQFTAGKRFDVVKPTRLCAPALAGGDPIQSEAGYLMCYKVKPAAGEPKHTAVVGSIHTTSQIARERLDTTGEDELCVPSLELAER